MNKNEIINKCVIVGAGEIDSSRLVFDRDAYIIAADGGLKYLLQAGYMPNLIIGDMDSLNDDSLLNDIINKYNLEKNIVPHIKRLPVEKDDTDMLAAIKEGLEKGCMYFEIYGGTGGRIDHTLANIQCLLYLHNHDAKGVIYGEKTEIMLICNDKITFPADKYVESKYISVFAYGGDAYGVTEKGLKYELEDDTIKLDFPIGISNEFVSGKESMIEVKKGKLLICVGDFL